MNSTILNPVDFQNDVVSKSSEVPVLVDFWAPWCGPCRVLGPTLERLDRQSGDRWTLAKFNVDDYPGLAAEYRIRAIPTVVLFSGGKPVSSFTGALSEAQIRDWLDEHLPN